MGTLDLNSAEFWDLSAVDKELRRVYDICGGCRRCLPLCPSFKVLFDRLDVEAVDGDVEKLPARDVKEVVDLCYQCKLCYNHCPYTPPHRWAVDFPRLMLRARAGEARKNGVSRQDRMLGNTELIGRLSSLAAPLKKSRYSRRAPWTTTIPRPAARPCACSSGTGRTCRCRRSAAAACRTSTAARWRRRRPSSART